MITFVGRKQKRKRENETTVFDDDGHAADDKHAGTEDF